MDPLPSDFQTAKAIIKKARILFINIDANINSRIYQLKFTSMQWLGNDRAAIKRETKRLLYFSIDHHQRQ
jgi:hypothetical protein